MPSQHEYAVKVGDRGWAIGFGDHLRATPPDPKSGGLYQNPRQAHDAADNLAAAYRQLGANEIATEVQVVTRIATTTYSDWAGLVDGSPATNE